MGKFQKASGRQIGPGAFAVGNVVKRYCQEKSTWRLHQVLFSSTEFGRRDWTRTNDPHHVKVVL